VVAARRLFPATSTSADSPLGGSRPSASASRRPLLRRHPPGSRRVQSDGARCRGSRTPSSWMW
jgi:hypothetical protein